MHIVYSYMLCPADIFKDYCRKEARFIHFSQNGGSFKIRTDFVFNADDMLRVFFLKQRNKRTKIFCRCSCFTSQSIFYNRGNIAKSYYILYVISCTIMQ